MRGTKEVEGVGNEMRETEWNESPPPLLTTLFLFPLFGYHYYYLLYFSNRYPTKSH